MKNKQIVKSCVRDKKRQKKEKTNTQTYVNTTIHVAPQTKITNKQKNKSVRTNGQGVETHKKKCKKTK